MAVKGQYVAIQPGKVKVHDKYVTYEICKDFPMLQIYHIFFNNN